MQKYISFGVNLILSITLVLMLDPLVNIAARHFADVLLRLVVSS